MNPETLKQLIEIGELVSPDMTDEEADEILRKISKNVSQQETEPAPELIHSFDEIPHKRTVQDFVGLFTSRYREIESMLRGRTELQGVASTARIKKMVAREPAASIALVLEKRETKNGNIILVLEDPTGTINAIANKNNIEAWQAAQDTALDEVIGVLGSAAGDAIFIEKIIIPDIPIREIKKSPQKEYLAILGDPHIGSNRFLVNSFGKFLQWINGDAGTPEQRADAKLVKNIIITGDLVEGVGVYPRQESDLEIADITEQYDALSSILAQIPRRIRITTILGNHDAGRLSEPQPALNDQYAKKVIALPNLTSVSNPATIRICKQPGFNGFDVLLYHGNSLPWYSSNIQSLKAQRGMQRADLIMQYLLKRRHLAPSHTSTLYVPTPKNDALVIKTVPDFFITGHTHTVGVSNYRSVTLINGSCWAGMSEDQEKRGIIAQPARVILVDLQTRKVKILNFLDKQDIEEGRSIEAVQ
jgi:DNA polymerase II small subunit